MANVIAGREVHRYPWRPRTRSREPKWLLYLLAAVMLPVVIRAELFLGIVRQGGPSAQTVLLIPITLCAVLGGLGPGLTATAAAALAADYFLLLPQHSLTIAGAPHILAWLGLIAAGASVSVLSEMLRRTRFRGEASLQRLRFLAEAGAVLARSLDYAATLHSVTKLAIEGPASLCLFHLLAEDGSPYLATYAHVNPKRGERLADAGRFLISERPKVEHPVLRTLRTGTSLFVPVVDDAWIAANATSDAHDLFMREFGIYSLMTVPVTGSSGLMLGALTLVLTAKYKHPYDGNDVALAEEFGRRAGAALENARKYAHELTFRRFVETTHDGILMLDERQHITFANQHMVELLGYANACEIIGRPLSDFLDPTEAAEAPRRLLRRKEGLSEHNEIFFRKRDGTALWTLTAATPLSLPQGPVPGAISLKLIMDITERKRVEAELDENVGRSHTLAEQLRQAADYDALTGLPNRCLFLARLDQALPSGQRDSTALRAILLVDIDRFTVINDSLGHAAGDALLAAFAGRLMTCLRPGDLLARIGGDEFAVFVDDVTDDRDATLAAKRILRALEEPFAIAGRDVSIAASIGIALGEPGFDDREEMLRDAGMAMRRAKERGRARYELFAPELQSRAIARLELEIKLRRSLERGELRLAYQPIVALDTGAIAGFEALARWEQRGGTIAPSEFIPLAEETGLILPLGKWALAEACRQARLWNDVRPVPPVAVSVNVSAKQLAGDLLVAQVEHVLAESGLPAELLNLEITESVLMERGEAAESALGRLCALGVTIHLDDFGTGYSSLSYLHRFPIHTVKIDRSFISGAVATEISNPQIVAAIIALAKSLAVDVTAEGVETAEQLRQLQGLRCTNAQGYFLSRPIDAAAALALITSADAICPTF